MRSLRVLYSGWPALIVGELAHLRTVPSAAGPAKAKAREATPENFDRKPADFVAVAPVAFSGRGQLRGVLRLVEVQPGRRPSRWSSR